MGYRPWGCKESDMTERLHFLSFYGVREGEVQKKNETGPLQEQISFNEARRGSSQISDLLHLSKKRVSIYRHVCGKLLS